MLKFSGLHTAGIIAATLLPDEERGRVFCLQPANRMNCSCKPRIQKERRDIGPAAPYFEVLQWRQTQRVRHRTHDTCWMAESFQPLALLPGRRTNVQISVTSSGTFALPERTRPVPRSTVVSRIEKRIATVAYSA